MEKFNKQQITHRISSLAILLFDGCKVTWEENYLMSRIEFQWAAIIHLMFRRKILVLYLTITLESKKFNATQPG